MSGSVIRPIALSRRIVSVAARQASEWVVILVETELLFRVANNPIFRILNHHHQLNYPAKVSGEHVRCRPQCDIPNWLGFGMPEVSSYLGLP